jgi:hypothetical protein
MKVAELGTYLNDHLAGSVGALDLIDYLARGSDTTDEVSFFRRLHAEITAEQTQLREVLRDVGGDESGVRKAAGWVAEKMNRLKLKWDDPGDDGLRRFEALEALALGITGKLSLWKTLGALAGETPVLRHLDFAELQRRSEDQYAAVESRRLAAAREAFTPSG